MASQKSTAAALAPKRQRGRLRVAAILDAGAAVFAEKGYDAATMTEIAARADTAIGSLYRFFPTKEVLAEALLVRYVELLDNALCDIGARAERLSPAALADALVDLMLEWETQRAAALVLVDTRSDAADQRSRFRDTFRRRLAAILMAATGTLPQARAELMATLLLHVLKSLSLLAREDATRRTALVAEVRELARLYLSHAYGTCKTSTAAREPRKLGRG
jgi:AcrR family transcriptional regulator